MTVSQRPGRRLRRPAGAAAEADQHDPLNAELADAMPVVDPLTEAVVAAQHGSEQAFSQLYRRIQPGLLRYLTVLVAAEAEDVAAETWFQVCRDLHTFTGDGDGFRGWVVTIGRHRALDQVRARDRRPATPYPLDYLAGHASSDDTAGSAAEAMSTADALELIAGLPQEQAEAVLLRTVIGLDAITAARVLGKRPGAVRMAAHRGLRRLAEQLDAPAIAPDGVTAGPAGALTELN